MATKCWHVLPSSTNDKQSVSNSYLKHTELFLIFQLNSNSIISISVLWNELVSSGCSLSTSLYLSTGSFASVEGTTTTFNSFSQCLAIVVLGSSALIPLFEKLHSETVASPAPSAPCDAWLALAWLTTQPLKDEGSRTHRHATLSKPPITCDTENSK